MFEIKAEADLCRIGELTTKNGKNKTPMLWISYEFFNPPNLWKYVDIEGLLVNVHNIADTKSLIIRLEEKNDLRKVISFKGTLMLDCGGVKFSDYQKAYDVKHILCLHSIIKPDIIISADYPISPTKSLNENQKRKEKTLKNLKEFVNYVENGIAIVPVIHGYTYNEIDWMIKKIAKISESFECYGIGSLVPILFPFNIKNAKKVIDLIVYVRKKLPNAFLHIFGMGSVLTMHIAFLAGADSVDSQSWVRCAGYGKIQIPGLGQRFVIKNNRKYKFSQWSPPVDWSSYWCNCPICKKENYKQLLISSKINRAIHNAYVLSAEARLARKFIQTGEYLEFVRDRLRKTSLFPIFKYIERKQYPK